MIVKLIQLLKNFFGISYKEARGLIFLFIFLFIAVLMPVLLKKYYLSNTGHPVKIVPLTERTVTSDSLKSESQVIFAFDPNTVSYDSLILLGLDERLSARLVSYRNNGGSFQKKSDVLKIYNLPQDWFEAVEDSILLPASTAPVTKGNSDFITNIQTSDTLNEQISTAGNEVEPADLNEADTLILQRVYGIGSVLSNRIVKFREKLGGFTDWSQLNEVYGLGDEVIEEMKAGFFIADNFETRKLQINKATFKEILAHPYLNFSQTKAIVNYRDQHGEFRKSADLMAIHLLSDSVVVKLEPYLSYE